MGNIHVSSGEDGILLLTFSGNVNDASDISALISDIKKVGEAVKEMYSKLGKSVRVLVDVSNFKAVYVDEAVNALVDLAKEDVHMVEKTGVFGCSMPLKVIGETILMLSGRKNIKFFDTKVQATEWLNS